MNQQQKLAQIRDQRVPASAKPAEPVTTVEQTDALATATRWAIIGIAFLAVIAALYAARSILMPVLAALLIGSTLSPLQKFAEQYRIPRGASAALLMLLFVAGFSFGVWMLAEPISGWIADAPQIVQAVKDKFRWFDSTLSHLKEMTGAVGEASAGKAGIGTDLTAIGQQALLIVTPALSEFLVFFGTLLFYLVGHNRLRRHLLSTLGTRESRLRVVRIWGDIESSLVGYISTVTVINVGVGVATAAMLWLIGFPSPLVWGILAFILNYIPYLGPAIFVGVLFLAGVVATPTLGSALLAPALFVGMTTIEGHMLTPGIVGRRFTVSPLVVFLGLAFWTWLWGPFGAFLAVPFLIVGQVIIRHLFPKEEVTLPG